MAACIWVTSVSGQLGQPGDPKCTFFFFFFENQPASRLAEVTDPKCTSLKMVCQLAGWPAC
jgi:hypothetical protein